MCCFLGTGRRRWVLSRGGGTRWRHCRGRLQDPLAGVKDGDMALALLGTAEEVVPTGWASSRVQQHTTDSAEEKGRWRTVAFVAGQGGRRLGDVELRRAG